MRNPRRERRGRKEVNGMFWDWLQMEHPVLYEVLHWCLLFISTVALGSSIAALIAIAC